jgi:predicted nucleic acid-binding Zn ribbon protein
VTTDDDARGREDLGSEPDEAGTPAPEKAADQQPPDEHLSDEHRPDGLDLARSASRAAAASPGTPPARNKSPSSRRRVPPKASGARPDDRDPQLLDVAMGRLIASHGWEVDLKVQGVFGRWAELVGTEVADHCTPESFDDGRLVVRTDSTAWATQLKLLAPSVVRRLNTELGHGTVTVIEVLGPHLPSWKKGRLSSRDGRGPRDTYG